MRDIIALEIEQPNFYEMGIQMLINGIWVILLEHRWDFASDEKSLNPKASARLKAILGFIHENYDKKITLDDIADSVHICKSECCRFFKKHMHESLFDYLLRYRVEQSISYLRKPKYSVTDAAFYSEFVDVGYYSQVFRNVTGVLLRNKKIIEHSRRKS